MIGGNMKAIDYGYLLRNLNIDISKTIQPLNATDNVTYLRAIVEGICHISKQIEEIKTRLDNSR